MDGTTANRDRSPYPEKCQRVGERCGEVVRESGSRAEKVEDGEAKDKQIPSGGEWEATLRAPGTGPPAMRKSSAGTGGPEASEWTGLTGWTRP